MSKLTELKAASALMLAEIEKLESEPKSIWHPKEGDTYHYVDNTGQRDNYIFYNDGIDKKVLRHHNAYQTVIQAEKAAALTKQANRIVQACINFDPDFVPNLTNAERKYSVGYYLNEKRWIVESHKRMDSAVAYVSSEEIAQSICDLFNKEGEA